MTAIFYFIYYFLISFIFLFDDIFDDIFFPSFTLFCVNIKIYSIDVALLSLSVPYVAARPDEEVAVLAYYGIRSCNTSASLNMLLYTFFLSLFSYISRPFVLFLRLHLVI